MVFVPTNIDFIQCRSTIDATNLFRKQSKTHLDFKVELSKAFILPTTFDSGCFNWRRLQHSQFYCDTFKEPLLMAVL